MPKIAIIGTTSWGTTLANVLARRKEHTISLWARSEEEAQRVSESGAGPRNSDKVPFPENVTVTSSMADAMRHARMVMLVVPSQTMRKNIRHVSPFLKKSMLIVSCAKGLEIGSNKRMSQVIAEEINPKFTSRICVLSGPNLSREVVDNLPGATVVAAGDKVAGRVAQRIITAENFCVYTNQDVIGVELCGALKNVIALGAGMMDGLGFGDNAKAALITRGLTEITALGVTLGASPLTFSGLAGLGDLIATCASPLSRNHQVGFGLTQGRSLKEITNAMSEVAEGVTTTVAVWGLAQQLGIEMPVTERIYQVLYQGANPGEVVPEFIGLEGRHELSGRKWGLFSWFRRNRGNNNH